MSGIPRFKSQITRFNIAQSHIPRSNITRFKFQIPHPQISRFKFHIPRFKSQIPTFRTPKSVSCRWSLVKDRFTDVEVYSYRPTDYCIFVGRQSVGRTRKTYDVSSPLLEYIMCINTYSVVWRVCVGHTLCILSAFRYQ